MIGKLKLKLDLNSRAELCYTVYVLVGRLRVRLVCRSYVTAIFISLTTHCLSPSGLNMCNNNFYNDKIRKDFLYKKYFIKM